MTEEQLVVALRARGLSEAEAIRRAKQVSSQRRNEDVLEANEAQRSGLEVH